LPRQRWNRKLNAWAGKKEGGWWVRQLADYPPSLSDSDFSAAAEFCANEVGAPPLCS